jgi:restriction endonuclease S subunit
MGETDGKYRFYISGNDKKLYLNSYTIESECLIIGNGGCANIHIDNEFTPSKHVTVCDIDINIASTSYVYLYMKTNIHMLEEQFAGAGIKWINREKISNIKIPIPSLEIQQKIVDELTSIEASIASINVRAKLIACEKDQYKTFGRWKELDNLTKGCERVELGDICGVRNGTRIVKTETIAGQYPVYGSGQETFTTNTYNRTGTNFTIGRFALSSKCVRRITGDFYLNDSGLTIHHDNVLTFEYVGLYLMYNQDVVFNLARGMGQKNLNMDKFMKLKIPLPSLEIQQQCIEIYQQKEAYMALMDDEITRGIASIQGLKALAKNIINKYCGTTHDDAQIDETYTTTTEATDDQVEELQLLTADPLPITNGEWQGETCTTIAEEC